MSVRLSVRTRRLTAGGAKFYLAEYLNRTRISTCILKYVNGKKVLRAKILTRNVLKRQIWTDVIAKERAIRYKVSHYAQTVFGYRLSMTMRSISLVQHKQFTQEETPFYPALSCLSIWAIVYSCTI